MTKGADGDPEASKKRCHVLSGIENRISATATRPACRRSRQRQVDGLEC